MVAYFLVLLEWTFSVASYHGFPLVGKEFTAYGAGFMCQKILELEKT